MVMVSGSDGDNHRWLFTLFALQVTTTIDLNSSCAPPFYLHVRLCVTAFTIYLFCWNVLYCTIEVYGTMLLKCTVLYYWNTALYHWNVRYYSIEMCGTMILKCTVLYYWNMVLYYWNVRYYSNEMHGTVLLKYTVLCYWNVWSYTLAVTPGPRVGGPPINPKSLNL